MASLALSSAPGVALTLNYNAGTGKVNSLDCDNQSTWLVHGVARLTDGRVFERDFPVGLTAVPLPANVLTVRTVVNDEGETVTQVDGLAGYSLGIQYGVR